jgi:hypothetical protein
LIKSLLILFLFELLESEFHVILFPLQEEVLSSVVSVEILFFEVENEGVNGGLKGALLELFFFTFMKLVLDSALKHFLSFQKSVLYFPVASSFFHPFLRHSFGNRQNIGLAVFFSLFCFSSINVTASNSCVDHLLENVPELEFLFAFQIPLPVFVKVPQMDWNQWLDAWRIVSR